MDTKKIKIGNSDPDQILFGKYKVQKANQDLLLNTIIPKDNTSMSELAEGVWEINDGWDIEFINGRQIKINKFKIDTWGLRHKVLSSSENAAKYINMAVKVSGISYVNDNIIKANPDSDEVTGFVNAYTGSWVVEWYPGMQTSGDYYVKGLVIQGQPFYTDSWNNARDLSFAMGRAPWEINATRDRFVKDGVRPIGMMTAGGCSGFAICIFGGCQTASSKYDESNGAYRQYDITDHPIIIDLDVDDLTQPIDPTSVECWDAYCVDTPLYHKDKTVDNCWKTYGFAIPKNFNITKKGLSSNDYIEWISPLKFKVKGVPSTGISINTAIQNLDVNYAKIVFVPFNIKIHNKPAGVNASIKRIFSNITTSEDTTVSLSNGDNTIPEFSKIIYRNNSSSNIGYTECTFTFNASSNIEDSFTVEIVPDFRGKPIYKVDFSGYKLIPGATADEFVAEDHKIMFKNPKAGETIYYTFAASPVAYENGAIATLKTTGLGSVANKVNIIMSANPIGAILQIDKIYNAELTWDGRTAYKDKTTIGVVGGEGRTITIEELPTYEDPDIISLNTDIWSNIFSSLVVPETVDMEDYMDKILWNIKPANTSIWNRVKAWYETHDAPLLTGQFSNSRGLEEITLNLRKGDAYLYCDQMMNNSDIKKVIINCPKSSKISSLNGFFKGAAYLNNIVPNLVNDEENGDLNIKAIVLPTDVAGAFSGCTYLETYPADFINWYNPHGNVLGETMPATLIAYAFEYCHRLKSIPSFDYEAAGYPSSANEIRSCRGADQAFMDCIYLESIGPTLDLILVTSNYKMFQGCNALTSAKIKNLNHVDWDFTDTLKALDEESIQYLFDNLVDLTTHDAEKHEDTIDKSFKNWNSRYWTEYQTNPDYPVIFTNVRTAVCRKITQSNIYIASTRESFDSMNLTIYGLEEYNAGQDNEAAKIIVKQNGTTTVASRTTDGSFNITNPNGKYIEIILNATSIADRTPYIQIVVTNGLDFSNPIADHANLKCPAEWGEHAGVSKFDFATNMTKSLADSVTSDSIVATTRQASSATATLAWSTTKPATIKFKVEGLVDGDTLGIGEGGGNSTNLSTTLIKVTEDGTYTFTVNYDTWGFKLWNDNTSINSTVTITSLEDDIIPSKITGAMVANANAKGWTVYVDNEIVTPNTFKDDKVYYYNIAKQKATNKSLSANPVLEDLSFKYKNVDWKTFQNYTGFGDNRGTVVVSDDGHSMNITQVDGINSLIEVTPNIVASVPIKVTITGIPQGATLRYRYETDISSPSPNAVNKYFEITEDGDYILPYSNVTCRYNMGWNVMNFTGECNITITQRVAHDMSLHNFTFGGLSGVGTTAVNKIKVSPLYTNEVTSDGLKAHINRIGSTVAGTYVCRIAGLSNNRCDNFRIKVSNYRTSNTSITDKSKALSINAYKQSPLFNAIVKKISKDGIYDIDVTEYDLDTSIVIACYSDTVADIEILPYYENALVFNGTAPKYVYNMNNLYYDKNNVTNNEVISYNKFHISTLKAGFVFNSTIFLQRNITGTVGQPLTIDNPAYYIKVTGLEDGYRIWVNFGYRNAEDTNMTWSTQIYSGNGVLKVPADSRTIEPLDENSTILYTGCRIGVSRTNGGTLTEDLPVDITIEFLPIYDAATTTMYADIPNIPLNEVKTMIMDFVPLSDYADMWYYCQRIIGGGSNFAVVNHGSAETEEHDDSKIRAYVSRNVNGTYINGELNTTKSVLSLLQERHTVAVKSSNNTYSSIYIGHDTNDNYRHQQMALYSLIGFDRVLSDSEIQYWSDKLLKQHKNEDAVIYTMNSNQVANIVEFDEDFDSFEEIEKSDYSEVE